MADTIIIIFGATGDLSKRMIFPALYRLYHLKKLSNVTIIGAALDPMSLDQLISHLTEFVEITDNDSWKNFTANIKYVPLNFTKLEDFQTLQAVIEKLDTKQKTNRLIYCATGSKFFDIITQHVAQSGIVKKQEITDEPWHRIAFEKPFGHDFESAEKLYNNIIRYINKNQMFLIDHYLAKELVQNITFVRFSNRIFQAIWSHHHIEQIDIILNERVGIEQRGKYYDSAGALLDVVQNHMLQMLSLIGMSTPAELTNHHISKAKIDILKKAVFVDGILGQYIGYRQEKDVAPQSMTDTFAALKIQVENETWHNVPFFLITGKNLDRKEVFIRIKLKPVTCKLPKGCETTANYLIIRIAPDSGFELQLNAKKPGVLDEIIPIVLEFCYSCNWPISPHGYEVIFQGLFAGEQTIFADFDQISYCWKLIDKIKSAKLPLYFYEKGTKGPAELAQFLLNNK